MKKITIYKEVAYLFGVVFVAFGVVCSTKANLGLSMIVLPAYVLYQYVSQFLPFFTFGMAEYTFQAVLLIIMIGVLRKFKISYFFSFVTAVFYGFVLDGLFLIFGDQVPTSMVIRIIWFVLGMFSCAFGVSMMFHTYIAPEVYELFVKEVSTHFNKDIHKFKTIYDIISLISGIILSLLFFGFICPVGFNFGTLFLALINGFVISRFSKFFETYFEFKTKMSKFEKMFTK